VLPLAARLRNPFVITREADIPVTGISREKLMEAGHDGIILELDGVPSEVVVFDPANVRSRFAAFDPARSSSGNLLAGFAPIGAGAAIGAVATRRDNRGKT